MKGEAKSAGFRRESPGKSGTIRSEIQQSRGRTKHFQADQSKSRQVKTNQSELKRIKADERRAEESREGERGRTA